MGDQEKVEVKTMNGNNLTSPESDNDEEAYLLDVDRMVNEGLGGGQVTISNGYIGDIPPDKLFLESEDEF
ncbi:hypothetical protein [Paenibacillus macquariensis]|uniref:Uncharacterized protein n=1 Tax=Paenibacillus macquariensis TaxID=948756 RepID=A0ABY1JR07_9BACL|nr:hypothetical protein [Paenibacillus macquariensis]MEC0092654.1 hypothetical protein [Paenibacillus macquariensis]OAB36592.1 hypothetical protein PMSM_06205 [Paenibacillus macquariensis subsp. macquariensis]SIQ63113.1 hypothetical protein SAMN05421578_10391 [Paenibacillus macquariensis]